MIQVRVRFYKLISNQLLYAWCCIYQDFTLLLLAQPLELGGQVQVEVHGHADRKTKVQPRPILIVLARWQWPNGEQEIGLAKLDALFAVRQ
jgi:hypothetical protein